MREPNISKQQLSTYHANSFSTGVIGVIGVMHALYLRSHQASDIFRRTTPQSHQRVHIAGWFFQPRCITILL